MKRIVIVASILGLLIVLGVGWGKALLGMLFEKALGIDMHPSVGTVASKYDATPAPVDIDSRILTGDVLGMENSLYFLGPSGKDGKFEVEYDSFVLPNGAYAHPDITWTKLMNTSGANILRAPTAQEKKNDVTFSQVHIYATDKVSKPDYAEGNVHLLVPCQFAHVTFLASEANHKRSSGPLSVTLATCKNDLIALKIKGVAKSEDAIIVLRDSTGGRLQEAESERDQGSNGTAILKAQGTIAKVEIFYPTAFADNTFTTLASSEPASFNVDPIVVKSSRYVKSGIPASAAMLDETAIKAQTSILAGRNDALCGFNDPEIMIKLPANLNSAYSEVDFGKPVLHGANGEMVNYTVQNNGTYDQDSSSTNIEFTASDAKQTLTFAHATGSVHLRYPAQMREVRMTPSSSRSGALLVHFQGAKIVVDDVDSALEDAGTFLPDDLALVRAYDASGRQLKPLNYHSSCVQGGEGSYGYAFWGKPAVVRVYAVDRWITLDLPFDLPPAKLLANPG